MIDAIRNTISSAVAGDGQSILLLAAIYILLVCGYSVIWQMRVNAWPSVSGQLERLGLRKYGAGEWALSNQEYAADALYTYQVDGKAYSGKRISPWLFVASHNLRSVLRLQLKGVNVGSGNEVKVYYNPRKPEKSFLVRTGLISQIITALIGIAPLSFYLAAY